MNRIGYVVRESELGTLNNDARKSMPLFPIGIVMSLTELTARQIRYYEEHGLISPERTEGKTRIFSFNDVNTLLDIKTLLEQGYKIAGIKEILKEHKPSDKIVTFDSTKKDSLSNAELRKMLKEELYQAGRYNRTSLRQGDMSRFFRK